LIALLKQNEHLKVKFSEDGMSRKYLQEIKDLNDARK
jgi:hypothetical protein